MIESPDLPGLTSFPIARRRVMTGLMSGLTLATTRVEAQVIHTDTAGIEAGEAQVRWPTASAHLLRPPAGRGRFPIVLVCEEIFGVHEYIKDICRRLAHAGYFAVAPEIYARIADLSKMTDVGAILRDVVARTPDAAALSDMDAAVAWAGANGGDPGRAGVIGFCRGGRNTWLYAAHSTTVKAAVAWYGPVGGATSDIQPKTPTDVAGALHCPLLGLYGGRDSGIPVAEVQAAAAKARAAGGMVEIVVYPDAGHGFHADYRPSYRAADAADGWRRMLAWLRTHGVA